jgi:hypothetical protein
MAAILALSAGPAMADEVVDDFGNVIFLDGNFDNNDVLDDEEFLFVDPDNEELFDELCSPGIDIDLAGCIFSDDEDEDFDLVDIDEDDLDIDEDDLDDFIDHDLVFVVDDDIFDDDNDHNRHHNRR